MGMIDSLVADLYLEEPFPTFAPVLDPLKMAVIVHVLEDLEKSAFWLGGHQIEADLKG